MSLPVKMCMSLIIVVLLSIVYIHVYISHSLYSYIYFCTKNYRLLMLYTLHSVKLSYIPDYLHLNYDCMIITESSINYTNYLMTVLCIIIIVCVIYARLRPQG